jgi:Na+-translocating ferredoxin:NAD+ oxidoreductase RnfE subunit
MCLIGILIFNMIQNQHSTKIKVVIQIFESRLFSSLGNIFIPNIFKNVAYFNAVQSAPFKGYRH